jgi:hypothetical protein
MYDLPARGNVRRCVVTAATIMGSAEPELDIEDDRQQRASG